jgi:hypothetical protein
MIEAGSRMCPQPAFRFPGPGPTSVPTFPSGTSRITLATAARCNALEQATRAAVKAETFMER